MMAAVIRWAALMCASLSLWVAPAASAQPAFTPGSTCYAADPLGLGFGQLRNRAEAWDCDPDNWSIASERVILRFDLRGTRLADDKALVTRLTRFETIRLTTIGIHGGSASRVLTPDELDRASHDWLMSAPVPQIGEIPVALFVEIRSARHLGMLTDAQVGPPPDEHPGALRIELLLALLCGLLIVPFVYNVAFYQVLRERFLLWHAAAVAFMFAHTLISSGLVNRFAELTVTQISVLSVLTWAGGIIAASLFIINLVEPGKLDAWHLRAARALTPWIAFWAVFYLFADGQIRAWATPLYYASFLPVMTFFVLVMGVALVRGSRAILFQIAAWAPIMLVGGTRIVTALGLFGPPMEMMLAQHVAIALEVIITSLGVADRFMVIKRQRDRALAETRSLEHKVERDALTGLLNRRSIGTRFSDLQELGFDTMAVIDLDLFKQVNDTHGHATGDMVLRATALALAPDDDCIAVRMGGEEFLLLLRGPGSVQGAERRRKAITTRIASDVPGLDRPVTASMGLVEQPRGSRVEADFISLYAHCDRLLYEAKRAGRNRMMSERVTRFERRSLEPIGDVA